MASGESCSVPLRWSVVQSTSQRSQPIVNAKVGQLLSLQRLIAAPYLQSRRLFWLPEQAG